MRRRFPLTQGNDKRKTIYKISCKMGVLNVQRCKENGKAPYYPKGGRVRGYGASQSWPQP